MFATGDTVGLAEWIIDDTCLVFLSFCSDQANLVYPLRKILKFALKRFVFDKLEWQITWEFKNRKKKSSLTVNLKRP